MMQELTLILWFALCRTRFIFLKYIQAPTTVLAAKGGVTDHNLMAALYSVNSYFQRLKKLEFGSDEEMKARLVAK